jgi:Zn ribbon nucleic-acid-binding protein
MATNPKMKPCPKCEKVEDLAVYIYDGGAQHVECDACFYLGPAASSRRWAVKLHNQAYIARQIDKAEAAMEAAHG